MNFVRLLSDYVLSGFKNPIVNKYEVISVLLVSVIIAFYEFIVYRFVYHKAFYNKSFHMSLVILPPVIATIILCLQSNSIITLGTIGALAIIRYRTVIKDPVDMIFMLWAVHIGITCGCQLYNISFMTSVVITIILLVLNYFLPSFVSRKGLFTLVIYTQSEDVSETEIEEMLKKHCKKYRIKSRSYTQNGLNLVVDINLKEPKNLSDALHQFKKIEKFSLIEYDSEDII